MEEQKQPVGNLFGGAISYYNESDVYKFIDNMTHEQAFYAITQALNFSQSKGIFDLRESEIVSKSLRVLTSQEKETPTEE